MGRDRILRRMIHDRFIVSLANGESFDGLLIDVDESVVRLANADVISKTSRVSVDGDLYIPRSDILYMQKPRSA